MTVTIKFMKSFTLQQNSSPWPELGCLQGVTERKKNHLFSSTRALFHFLWSLVPWVTIVSLYDSNLQNHKRVHQTILICFILLMNVSTSLLIWVVLCLSQEITISSFRVCVKDLAGMESQHDPVTVDYAVIGGKWIDKSSFNTYWVLSTKSYKGSFFLALIS